MKIHKTPEERDKSALEGDHSPYYYEGEKEIKAEFIADLYECRAKMIRPLNSHKLQDPQEVLQYNWLNVIIANLTNKYRVDNEDVSNVLRNRQRKCPSYVEGGIVINCNCGKCF